MAQFFAQYAPGSRVHAPIESTRGIAELDREPDGRIKKVVWKESRGAIIQGLAARSSFCTALKTRVVRVWDGFTSLMETVASASLQLAIGNLVC